MAGLRSPRLHTRMKITLTLISFIYNFSVELEAPKLTLEAPPQTQHQIRLVCGCEAPTQAHKGPSQAHKAPHM
jgi:hypothetical protein